ncbi:MAG: hypothetical protein HOP02_09270 [Methylococcaceae bacterium]|nr:hypothetical protein [Methylococcaceae bacterium]
MTKFEEYSISVSFIFWILWCVGFLITLLFFLFIFITGSEGAWPVTLWNTAVVMAEGFILFKSNRYFLHKKKSASELLLWVGFSAIGVPMIAFGGCMLGNWGFRIAG